MARKKDERKEVTAWAWLMEGGLCYWAEPTREQLMAPGKPSPEAKAVRVRLVRIMPKKPKAR